MKLYFRILFALSSLTKRHCCACISAWACWPNSTRSCTRLSDRAASLSTCRMWARRPHRSARRPLSIQAILSSLSTESQVRKEGRNEARWKRRTIWCRRRHLSFHLCLSKIIMIGRKMKKIPKQKWEHNFMLVTMNSLNVVVVVMMMMWILWHRFFVANKESDRQKWDEKENKKLIYSSLLLLLLIQGVLLWRGFTIQQCCDQILGNVSGSCKGKQMPVVGCTLVFFNLFALHI